MKKLIALLLAFALLAGCLTACGQQPQGDTNTPDENEQQGTENVNDPEAAKRGGVMQYVFNDLSPTFDPYGQSAWSTYIWAQNAFENCLVRGVDGKVYPLVCEYEYPEDGMSLKLWIREGVKFSDGTPVTLEDVVASLQRAALFTVEVKSNLWDYVASYEIVDNVLTFQFTEYHVSTFEVFCSPRASYGGIMPKSICDKYGDILINDPNDCIGTGPYKLIPAESKAGVKYVFERNEHYAVCEASPDDNGIASPRRQYLDKLVCVKNENTNSRLMSLMAGELDLLDYTNDDAYKSTLQAQGYTEELFYIDSALYMFFNCNEKRATADVNLRRAIAAALNFDDICYAVRGNQADLTADGPINIDGYSHEAINSKDYNSREANLELAKQYLAQSNYKGETLVMANNIGTSAPLIVEQLKAVGINCQAVSLDNATCIAYAADDALDWDFIYRSNPRATWNPADIHSTFYRNWNNERADELVELLNTVPVGSAESIAYWEELAELMGEEVPFVVFGGMTDYYNITPGLNLNRVGPWRYFFNAYWDDPQAHMK